MEKLSVQGFWWVPSQPDEQVPGQLEFDGRSYPRLTLLGDFQEFGLSEVPGFDVIQGIVRPGHKITLYRCARAGWSLSSVSTSTYLAHYVFRGYHFPSGEAVRFVSATIAYDDLVAWSGRSAFELSFPVEGGPRGTSVTCRLPDQPRATVGTYDISLVGSVRLSMNPFARDLTWSQEMAVRTIVSAPLRIEVLLDNVFFHVQNFLTLGVGQPVYPRQATAEIAPDTENQRQTVDVFFATPSGEAETETHPARMTFTMRDLGDQFEGSIRKWFELAQQYEPAYELLFSTKFARRERLRPRFLSLVQALEVFHRTSNPEGYVDPTEWRLLRLRLRALLASEASNIDQATTDAMISRIPMMNTLSLRDRVYAILVREETVLHRLYPDLPGLARKIARARNYLTHFGSVEEQDIPSDLELSDYIGILEFVLEVQLMRLLDMPPAVFQRRTSDLLQAFQTPRLTF